MTGAKTNERPGTRAQVRHSGVSAYKAREVLNQIRGLAVVDAADVLALSERGVSEVIGGCLDSAVANAEHNDLQFGEELFVSACYADEGPTAKRWRPRARGRATPIRKRTCHITIIVSRLDDDRLEMRKTKAERAVTSGGRKAPKADRAARVAKSKQTDEVEDIEADTTAAIEEESASVEAPEVRESGGEDVSDDSTAEEETAPASSTATGSEESSDAEAGADEAASFGTDSHAPLEDDSMPEGYPVKGNADSMKFHQPGGRWYDSTVAEVWFTNAEAAEAEGFVEAGTKKTESGGDE